MATLILFVPVKQKTIYTHRTKLESKYEQQSKIRRAISKHKMQLIPSSESLNRRVWSLHDHFEWLNVRGKYDEKNHYISSFAYRILSLLAWIKKMLHRGLVSQPIWKPMNGADAAFSVTAAGAVKCFQYKWATRANVTIEYDWVFSKSSALKAFVMARNLASFQYGRIANGST